MSEVKSDIQIAREAKMQPITEVLAKVESSLYQMLKALVEVRLTHEAGHKGEPFNELVDSLCTCFCKVTDGISIPGFVAGDSSVTPIRHLAMHPMEA